MQTANAANASVPSTQLVPQNASHAPRDSNRPQLLTLGNQGALICELGRSAISRQRLSTAARVRDETPQGRFGSAVANWAKTRTSVQIYYLRRRHPERSQGMRHILPRQPFLFELNALKVVTRARPKRVCDRPGAPFVLRAPQEGSGGYTWRLNQLNGIISAASACLRVVKSLVTWCEAWG